MTSCVATCGTPDSDDNCFAFPLSHLSDLVARGKKHCRDTRSSRFTQQKDQVITHGVVNDMGASGEAVYMYLRRLRLGSAEVSSTNLDPPDLGAVKSLQRDT